MGWAAEEFEGIDLGDRRLDSRAVLLLERLADKPTASIPGACNGWGETQAAYRFFAPVIVNLLAACWLMKFDNITIRISDKEKLSTVIFNLTCNRKT